jgi:tRNA A-37 threonylcarbamoyl transferase component Bud32
MAISGPDAGICPNCEQRGAVGDTCGERVCGKRGLRFVPADCFQPGQEVSPLVGRCIGKNLICKVLGRGGFGTVYLALQLPILMKVALKQLHRQDDPAELERLLRKFELEGRALAQLNHPNIVRLIEYGEHDGAPFLVMEYVPGSRTLKRELKERGDRGATLELSEVRSILFQTLDGLSAAHAVPLLHRDLKPENLMLQSVEGNPLMVRLVDFGLVKFTSEEQQSSRLMGTPAYMAPEQFRQADLGPWTDLYAVGAMAFELLTGLRLFPQCTAQQIMSRKLDRDYDPGARAAEAGVPAETVVFLRRAMARDPGDRFRSCRSFREGLEQALTAMEQGGLASTMSIDVSGLVDSRELAGVGAQKRALEAQQRALEEKEAAALAAQREAEEVVRRAEKARLKADAERRQLEEEKLRWQAERARVVDEDSRRGEEAAIRAEAAGAKVRVASQLEGIEHESEAIEGDVAEFARGMTRERWDKARNGILVALGVLLIAVSFVWFLGTHYESVPASTLVSESARTHEAPEKLGVVPTPGPDAEATDALSNAPTPEREVAEPPTTTQAPAPATVVDSAAQAAAPDPALAPAPTTVPASAPTLFVKNRGNEQREIKSYGGEAGVIGSLDKEVIQKFIRKHMSEVKWCYEQALRQDPTVNGKVLISFVISPLGHVLQTKIKETTMHNAGVEECLRAKVMRWKFPEPKGGGIVVVNYPFIFKTTE